jgi:hypothetical protein
MTASEKIGLTVMALAAITIGVVTVWQAAVLADAWPYGLGAVKFLRSAKA